MEQDEIYQHLWTAHDNETEWDKSLGPRSPDLLFDIAAALGVDPTWAVLDVGCGRGNHVCELAHRFGCQSTGLDTVESNLALCHEAAESWKLSGQITFVQGSIEALPFDAQDFNLIWCRDMLVHVQELGQSLQECRRVLKPHGIMLVLTTFATDLMEPQEQGRLCDALGLSGNNLSRQHMEQCFAEAGLKVVATDWVGSELAEFYEERDGRYSRELRRLARMTRKNPGLEREPDFAVSRSLYTWGIYQLLGKLGIMVYTLKETGPRFVDERIGFVGDLEER